MTADKGHDEGASAKSGGGDLSAEQTAALQLVTIAPAPRTAAELAASYAGQAGANLWPEQTVEQVEAALADLVGQKLVKEGEKAPDGAPVLELA